MPCSLGAAQGHLSTALSIAEPPVLTPPSLLAQGLLTPRLSCENQSSLPDFILQQLWDLSYFYHAQEAGGQGRAGTSLLGGVAVEVTTGKSWQLSFCLKVQSKGPDLEQSHI